MDKVFQNIIDFRRRFFAIPPLSAILVFFVFFAGALSARVNTDVERELDNTDLIIERVQDIFPEEPTLVMIDNFELAVSMQTDAREAFAEDDQMLALSLTRQAREIALRLERIILAAGYKPPEGPPNAILRVLEQNDELIEELTPSVDEFGDAIIRRDFAAYIDMHISAWNFYNDENFPVSGQLAQVARDRFLQIRRALIEAARLFSPEKIQSELDNARELVHETERGLFPEALEAVELHDMALELLSEAELMFANARPREAMRLIDEVVVLSRRSSEIARRGGLSTDRLEEEISRTEAIIAEATENLADGSRPEASGDCRRSGESPRKGTHLLPKRRHRIRGEARYRGAANSRSCCSFRGGDRRYQSLECRKGLD